MNMNDLEQLLANPSTGLGMKSGKPLFMAHLIAGYPSVLQSEKVARALVRGGANILEVQIPFSDPMADGPTIAVACEEALKRGTTVAKALSVIKSVSKLGAPVVVMSYANPVFRYDIPRFVKTISTSGASGLIVPDCPFDTEEGQALLSACKEHGVCLIPVVSPGVPIERIKVLAENACGFWYCTSRQGITGATSVFASVLPDFLRELRSMSKIPVAIGFGVKSKKDVRELSKVADIVIAGSVFVSTLKKGSVTTVEKTMRDLIS
jgi:tryptophan synthase alpha chain